MNNEFLDGFKKILSMLNDMKDIDMDDIAKSYEKKFGTRNSKALY
jgi:hypothetical protein